MSQEVSIIAIIQPAPGKLDRLKELLEQGISWMESNEPGTLEFSIYEEHNAESTRLSVFERYASQDAVEKHESSENYQNFFKLAVEEELLAAPPIVVKGKPFRALNR